MKIIHINSIMNGGAARAAYNIHKCLLTNGANSQMWVNVIYLDDKSVVGIKNKIKNFFNKLKLHLIKHSFLKLFSTNNNVVHSPSFFSSNWTALINKSNADIVHLHWVQNEMLSIKDISKINKPIVWTVHDMWPFCGAEHYTNNNRWVEGYSKNNKPYHETGFDINQWTWNRKKKYWKKPMQMISPSNWLMNCVKRSKLMSSWPVKLIMYPTDTKKFRPMNQKTAREKLSLPPDIPLILFGASGDIGDPRKGFDLLSSCLDNLNIINFELVIFGPSKKKNNLNLKFPIHYMGEINDDNYLALIYNACDLLIVPSRQDNLPNTALEAQSCGIPVVAYSIGGLPDIIEHLKTGYLAKPFEKIDLANGIIWTIDHARNHNFKKNIRDNAIAKFSPSVIAKEYKKIYEEILR